MRRSDFPSPPTASFALRDRFRLCADFALDRRGAGACEPGVGQRLPSRVFDGGDGISQVPGESLPACPDPRPRWADPILAIADRIDTAFRTRRRRRPHNLAFRGSLSRPAGLLSTLRSPGRPGPRKTRYRPAGFALAGRDFHPLDSSSSFRILRHSSFLSIQASPGATSCAKTRSSRATHSRRLAPGAPCPAGIVADR